MSLACKASKKLAVVALLTATATLAGATQTLARGSVVTYRNDFASQEHANGCRTVFKRVRGKRVRVRICKHKRAVPSAGKVVASIGVDAIPVGLVITPDAVWVAQHQSTTLARIDPARNRVVAHVTVAAVDGAQPARVITAGGFIWAVDYSANTVVKVDPQTNVVLSTIALPKEACCLPAAGAGSIWVLNSDDGGDFLTRLDAVSGAILASIRVPPSDGVAFTDGSVWGVSGNSIWKVDPATNALSATFPVQLQRAQDHFVTAGAGSIWISAANKVIRFDPATSKVVTTIAVPGASPVAATDNAIWVASSTRGLLERINPRTDKLVGQVRISYGDVADVQVGPASVWLSLPTSDRVLRIRPRW